MTVEPVRSAAAKVGTARARGRGLPRPEPGAGSAGRGAAGAALMRSLKDYSAENGLHIEGAARALTSAARSAHPAQVSRAYPIGFVSDRIRYRNDRCRRAT